MIDFRVHLLWGTDWDAFVYRSREVTLVYPSVIIRTWTFVLGLWNEKENEKEVEEVDRTKRAYARTSLLSCRSPPVRPAPVSPSRSSILVLVTYVFEANGSSLVLYMSHGHQSQRSRACLSGR